MNRQFLIVPDWNHLDQSARIANAHGAAFEYDDFFDPAVYANPEELERRIAGYLALGRDTSKDTLHGVFFDLAPNSADPTIRDYCLGLMEQSFAIAKRLGCRGVVFHTGLLSGLRLPSYRAGWLKTMEPIYRKLCLANPEMELYLENSTEQEPDLLVAMAKQMADVPNFRLCLDYAHASLTACPTERWAESMGPFVGHIHLNDNDGISDLHRVPGEGIMDYAKFARLADRYFPEVPVLLELNGAEQSELALSFMEALDPASETVFDSEPLEMNSDELMSILDTTLDISRSKDKTALLNLILTKSMEIAGCDAGTLYVLKEDGLYFKIMKTLSMGVDVGGKGEPIDLPPVALKESNVCAYSAIHRTIINVPDVYANADFDFSGPKRYDAMTGYTTRSMLTIPLMDQDSQVLGVMQLLNARNSTGQLCPFDHSCQRIIEILAAQVTIALEQANYIEEIRTMLWSFTAALAEAIDRRTPYNGSHTRKVAEYAGDIADALNQAEGTVVFDTKRRENLVMAALLHDIGKMVVPTSVMNKSTRLGVREETVYHRFALTKAKARIAYLEGKLPEERWKDMDETLTEVEALVRKCNTAGFIPDDTLTQLKEAMETVITLGEEEIVLFTPEEKTSLAVQKGTLTSEERGQMEAHVTYTRDILSKVHFNSDYAMAPVYAAQHHEFLNGKGYPNHLKGDEIPLESRILAVADICDALLAADRPYKKAMPKDKAFQILRSMAAEGSLDSRLVELMIASIDQAEGGTQK